MKRLKCPECGSKNIAKIIYGYPSEELLKESENNQDIILGGCIVSTDSSELHCNDCSYEWIENEHQLMILIDRAIKESWVDEIKNDMKNMYILYEDTLKNAFYFHLRNKLRKLLKDNNIRIFTEFHDGKLSGKGVKVDIAIVKIDEKESEHLKQKISKIYAVIELKHKGRNVSVDYFIRDVEKTLEYIKDKELTGCQFYLGFIHEGEFDKDEISWLQDRKQERLANGRLTELSANYYTDIDEMLYTVNSYNNMNTDLNSLCNDCKRRWG